MLKKIPAIEIPIIDNKSFETKNLRDTLKNKKVIIFGVPGAFTPTCSEAHLPGFIELYDKIIQKGINEIYCLAVNDKYVLDSWLSSYENGYKIKGIADGNAEITKFLNLEIDKTSNFMGIRCVRFAMVIDNNNITNIYLEKNGQFNNSSALNILSNL